MQRFQVKHLIKLYKVWKVLRRMLAFVMQRPKPSHQAVFPMYISARLMKPRSANAPDLGPVDLF